MENYRINTNYAKALYLLATDTSSVDTVCNDMKLVEEVCTKNHILNVVFGNPTIREAKKVAIIQELFGEKVEKVTLLFLSFVVRKRRAVNLKGIASAYIDMYRENNNIVLAELRTAVDVDVDEETRAMIRRVVGEYTNQTVELKDITDIRMLGGFCLKFNNYLYDARLRRKLAKLRIEFSKNIYEKGI